MHRVRHVTETLLLDGRLYMRKFFLEFRFKGCQLDVQFFLVLHVYGDILGDRLQRRLRASSASWRHPSIRRCSRHRPRSRRLLAASSAALCVAQFAACWHPRNRDHLGECASGTPPLRVAASVVVRVVDSLRGGLQPGSFSRKFTARISGPQILQQVTARSGKPLATSAPSVLASRPTACASSSTSIPSFGTSSSNSS